MQQICGGLWGPDHADPGSITKNSGRKVISYDTIISGKASRPLQVNERLDGLGKQLVGFSKEVSNLRFVSPKVEVLKAGVGGAALGAGLGFVFSAAGVLKQMKGGNMLQWKVQEVHWVVELEELLVVWQVGY